MKELTGARAEILRLLFTNTEQHYYMQEIGRILHKKPGVFQRTINNLEKEGILTSEFRANARYFMANKDYPLYKELKSIIFKTVGIAGSIKELLNKNKGIKYAFIYGSFAKARENYLSDIDLLIIGACEEDKLLNAFDKLEGLIKREINYKLYSVSEFIVEMKNKNPFLLHLMKESKIMIVGDEDELRKLSERKPDKKATA